MILHCSVYCIEPAGFRRNLLRTAWTRALPNPPPGLYWIATPLSTDQGMNIGSMSVPVAQPCSRGLPIGQSALLGSSQRLPALQSSCGPSGRCRKSGCEPVRAIAEPAAPFRPDAKHLQRWHPQVWHLPALTRLALLDDIRTLSTATAALQCIFFSEIAAAVPAHRQHINSPEQYTLCFYSSVNVIFRNERCLQGDAALTGPKGLCRLCPSCCRAGDSTQCTSNLSTQIHRLLFKRQMSSRKCHPWSLRGNAATCRAD